MKLFSRLMPFAAMLATAMLFAGCSKDTKTDEPDKTLSVSFTNLLHTPFTVTSTDTVTVSVKVTVANGTLTGVTMHYVATLFDNQTDAAEVQMTRADVGFYTARVPVQVAETVVKYWVTAVGTDLSGAEFSKISDYGNYVVSGGDEPVVTDPLAQIILNEVSTSTTNGKYIEIYNTSTTAVNLDSLELYRDEDYEEPYGSFSGHVIAAGGYGVFFAKSSSLTLPSGVVNLGVTDKGLTGSRSLKLELGKRAGKVIYDVFCNTVNPDVAKTDWDHEAAEIDGNIFARFDDGWYESGILTVGKVNLDPLTKLKHQALVKFASADTPYIRIIGFDPMGVAASKAVQIYADVFSDSFSAINSVVCNVNGTALTLTKTTAGDRFTASYTFASAGNYAVSAVATNSDGRTFTINNNVTVSAAGTTFGTQSDVRMNEVNTLAKYIEFYNTSANPVNLAGMYIEKNNEDIIYTITDNIIIKGHQFAVLVCSDKSYSFAASVLNLGTISNGISGKKSLCLEWMATIPSKVRIDSFCNTSDAAPKPKTTVWDDATAIEANISETTVGRLPDGSQSWFVLSKATMGTTNSASTAGTQLTHQLAK